MKEKLNDLYFSQSALNTFKTCPLKFKMKYIDELIQSDFRSNDSIKEYKQELGRLFHLSAERYFSGIPTGIDGIGHENPIVQWTKTLIKAIPIEDNKVYYPEYEIRFNGNMKLQAKYDLILKKEKNRYCIYDWKTEEKQMKMEKFKNSLQTILYSFLLVETGEGIFGEKISPDNVEMIYWQPSNPYKPLVIKYSQEQYLKDKWLLESLVENIMDYDFKNAEKINIHAKTCNYCDLQEICNLPNKKSEYDSKNYELY